MAPAPILLYYTLQFEGLGSLQEEGYLANIFKWGSKRVSVLPNFTPLLLVLYLWLLNSYFKKIYVLQNDLNSIWWSHDFKLYKSPQRSFQYTHNLLLFLD